MRIVAFQPDIPQNLGALMRLSACFGVELHVVQPCGFPYSDKAVRKAAMDYAAKARLVSHSGWSAFLADRAPGRLILLTTKGAVAPWDVRFEPGDHLVLGRESLGAPDYVHEACDARVRIPMPGGGRSLNVAMAAGMVAMEAMRQSAAPGDIA